MEDHRRQSRLNHRLAVEESGLYERYEDPYEGRLRWEKEREKVRQDEIRRQ